MNDWKPGRMTRREAATIIQRMAAQANGLLSEEEKIDVSLHVLRYTFLRKLAETRRSTMPAPSPSAS